MTGANRVAGRIDPEYSSRGDVQVDASAARDVLSMPGAYMGVDAEKIAFGVIRLCANALKLMSMPRRYGPRESVFSSFGGDRSMHAAALGRELHVRKVMIAPHPAVCSESGLPRTGVRQGVCQNRTVQTDIVSPAGVEAFWSAVESGLTEAFLKEDLGTEDVVFQPSVDACYYGQEHTVESRHRPFAEATKRSS